MDGVMELGEWIRRRENGLMEVKGKKKQKRQYKGNMYILLF